MTRPDLYRSGNTTSARFDHVRKNKDIKVDKHDNIILGTGGVSTFTSKQKKWLDKTTWILPGSAALNSDLEAENDSKGGPHWLIAPTRVISFDEFVSVLSKLNGESKKYVAPKKPTLMSAAKTDSPDLPRDSTHSSKSVRFVYSALAAVYHDHTPINEWDENDYAYISVLAAALDSGELELSDVRWKGPGHETTKAQRFVAEAVVAQMKVERKEVEERNDEDAEADLNNDHALLLSALNLDDEENPMSAYLN